MSEFRHAGRARDTFAEDSLESVSNLRAPFTDADRWSNLGHIHLGEVQEHVKEVLEQWSLIVSSSRFSTDVADSAELRFYGVIPERNLIKVAVLC
jgi:hypothetical protein